MHSLKVLGIESSCDDTAAAVVTISYEEKSSMKAFINSSIVFDQNLIHESFGGVVPELAARAHTEKLDFCVESALEKAQINLKDIDLISVTSGPGLIGGVISGVMFAKALALGLKRPLIAVNHLAGHALTPRLTHAISFPYLILLVSGGHCQFLIVEGPSKYTRLGGTIDDAPGEAFDKTAKILGLGYPGGPIIEKRAHEGNPLSYPLPKPLLNQNNCNMSFSGLKTALRREVDKLKKIKGSLDDSDINNLCASFQKTIADIFMYKSIKAMLLFDQMHPNSQKTIAIAGGVAANKMIGTLLMSCAKKLNFKMVIPEPNLCTDNAAMIAFAGAELYFENTYSDDTLVPRPRWPLDNNAKALSGSGKKGRKS